MRAALQEIMRHVHPFSRPWFGYLPPQDVHCNEFPTTADFWYEVQTRKTTTDWCNPHTHVKSNASKSSLKNTRSPCLVSVVSTKVKRYWGVKQREGRTEPPPTAMRAV